MTACFSLQLTIILSFAVAGRDYFSLQSIIRLDPGEERGCFSVNIINDSTVEDVEQFTLHLNYEYGTDGEGRLYKDKVDIWINDTDGMWLKLIV